MIRALFRVLVLSVAPTPRGCVLQTCPHFAPNSHSRHPGGRQSGWDLRPNYRHPDAEDFSLAGRVPAWNRGPVHLRCYVRTQ